MPPRWTARPGSARLGSARLLWYMLAEIILSCQLLRIPRHSREASPAVLSEAGAFRCRAVPKGPFVQANAGSVARNRRRQTSRKLPLGENGALLLNVKNGTSTLLIHGRSRHCTARWRGWVCACRCDAVQTDSHRGGRGCSAMAIARIASPCPWPWPSPLGLLRRLRRSLRFRRRRH